MKLRKQPETDKVKMAEEMEDNTLPLLARFANRWDFFLAANFSHMKK